jgi:hypothetical protein
MPRMMIGAELGGFVGGVKKVTLEIHRGRQSDGLLWLAMSLH